MQRGPQEENVMFYFLISAQIKLQQIEQKLCFKEF